MKKPALPPPQERTVPTVTVSLVRKLLASEDHCEWAAWFQWRYDVPREPPSATLLAWREEHKTLVAERTDDLEEHGFSVLIEFENWLEYFGSSSGTKFTGKPDIVVDERDLLTYEDCKTGNPCGADHVQVLLYVQLARWTRVRKRIAGVLVYPEGPQRVDMRERVPTRDRFLALLARFVSGTAPRVPEYRECGFCKVSAYCSDRITEDPDRTDWDPLFDERR